MEEKNPIQVSERIFRTIEFLAGAGPTGLVELSGKLSLNKSTVHRILNSLICMGYVRQDPETQKYSLSLKFCRISNQILAQNDIIDLARPYIRELAEQTGETVHLVQREGCGAVYIDKMEASHSAVRLVSMVGKTIPLYCSGVGKALLAAMDGEKIREIWEMSDIRPLTPHTITDFEEFMEQIAKVRRRGYALDDEENEPGVRCIAAALSFQGKGEYAVSVSAPKDRMGEAQLERDCALLLSIRDRLQREIG